jgi:hypothetical protein
MFYLFGLIFKCIKYFKSRTRFHGNINRDHRFYLDKTYNNYKIVLIIKYIFSKILKIQNKSIVKL